MSSAWENRNVSIGELSGKESRNGLTRFSGNSRERLGRAVINRERIVICGLPMWERIELIDILAQMIPRNHRVLVLEDRSASDPKLKEEFLPQNHVIMYYNNPNNVTPLSEIAKAALHMRGDYLIMPNLQNADSKAFYMYVRRAFEGLIVATDIYENDEAIRSIADVLVEIVSDRTAPLGIGPMWVRAEQHPA